VTVFLFMTGMAYRDQVINIIFPSVFFCFYMMGVQLSGLSSSFFNAAFLAGPVIPFFCSSR